MSGSLHIVIGTLSAICIFLNKSSVYFPYSNARWVPPNSLIVISLPCIISSPGPRLLNASTTSLILSGPYGMSGKPQDISNRDIAYLFNAAPMSRSA